jgi:hypothetical protein
MVDVSLWRVVAARAARTRSSTSEKNGDVAGIVTLRVAHARASDRGWGPPETQTQFAWEQFLSIRAVLFSLCTCRVYRHAAALLLTLLPRAMPPRRHRIALCVLSTALAPALGFLSRDGAPFRSRVFAPASRGAAPPRAARLGPLLGEPPAAPEAAPPPPPRARDPNRQCLDDDELDVDDVLPSIVRVFAQTAEPNLAMPWQRERPYESSGSGFVIALRNGSARVLTNAHVVEASTMLEARRARPARGSITTRRRATPRRPNTGTPPCQAFLHASAPGGRPRVRGAAPRLEHEARGARRGLRPRVRPRAARGAPCHAVWQRGAATQQACAMDRLARLGGSRGVRPLRDLGFTKARR